MDTNENDTIVANKNGSKFATYPGVTEACIRPRARVSRVKKLFR
jgi:hypothetical protein